MTVRIWHGRTPRNRANEYAAFLERRAIPDYRGIAGYLPPHLVPLPPA